MSAPRILSLLGLLAAPALAGGTLTPIGAPDQPIEILDHHVEVRIANGFARTEVSQVFRNPGDHDLEALYRFPIPESASLSEMSILTGETTLDGEVVTKDRADRVYAAERDAGQDAGLASKESYLHYEFRVASVPAQAESSFRFVYYQPLEIDTGLGRFVYPLEDGGTDELAAAFWTTESRVQRSFSFHATVSSAWPVEAVRVPGFEAAAEVQSHHPELWEVHLEVPGGIGGMSLDRDLVLYYRLADGLPGRVEVIPFRDSADEAGTFMVVVTPGIDLQPLSTGADYVFVLDVSGSMKGKIHTLSASVVKALGELRPEDRFRVIAFNNRAHELTNGYRLALPVEVSRTIGDVRALTAGNGTNLFEPLALALRGLDADRVTSLILVTDAVANEGELAPQKFHELLQSHDVRVFGFLLGNGGNWPLMRTLCEASGGFYAGVSNADDMLGQILLAKSKVTHEALHDATLTIEGGRTFDASKAFRGKVYRGQQLVMFGRYAEPGPAELKLSARLSGADKIYSTVFEFPAFDTDYPELERLWALDRIEEWQLEIDRGVTSAEEGERAIADLGVAYQLVTDQTSMLVLADEGFARNGIERKNRGRVGREREAQATRLASAPRKQRVDASRPAFSGKAPRLANGGGALGPWSLLVWLPLVALGLRRRRTAA